MLTRKLFEKIKRLDGEQRLEVLRFLLADTEPEIFVPDPPVLRWPPLRPDVPTYDPLPRVYTENYYETREEISFTDPEQGDYVLPAGSRLLFLGYSRWSRARGWCLHMYTLDKFPVLETYSGTPDATDNRMPFLHSTQLRALGDELSEVDRKHLEDLMAGDELTDPQPFIELASEP